jgi:hypothetical protein
MNGAARPTVRNTPKPPSNPPHNAVLSCSVWASIVNFSSGATVTQVSVVVIQLSTSHSTLPHPHHTARSGLWRDNVRQLTKHTHGRGQALLEKLAVVQLLKKFRQHEQAWVSGGTTQRIPNPDSRWKRLSASRFGRFTPGKTAWGPTVCLHTVTNTQFLSLSGIEPRWSGTKCYAYTYFTCMYVCIHIYIYIYTYINYSTNCS